MSKRLTHAMPEDARAALRAGGVEADSRARPPYQRNDCLGWIGSAKQDGTRRKRMVAELKRGGVYGHGTPVEREILNRRSQRPRRRNG